MPRLVINPGTPTAREFELHPGVNSVGRGPANDCIITDPSVSTSHCQITVNQLGVLLQDLGSTNGTFVNRAPVKEAWLTDGQAVRFGGIETLFCADAAAIQPAPAQPASPAPSTPKPPIMAVRIAPSAPTVAHPQGEAAPPPVAASPRPPLPSPARPAAAPSATQLAVPAAPGMVVTGAPCKHHPKTPGRFLCPQCGHHYCEWCVTARVVEGVQQKLCRHCGVPCTPVEVQVRQVTEAGFFQRIPEAFVYPVRGGGVMMLVAGTILLVFLRAGANLMLWGTIRALIYSLIIQVVLGGYLYAFLQSVIQTTTTGDKEMPTLPGISNVWEDIVAPCLQFIGMALICFGPAFAVIIGAAITGAPGFKLALIPALIMGYLYFPMAFLAVSVLDTVAAANPMFVVPSILKVFREYLVTLALLAGVVVLRGIGDAFVSRLFPEGMQTKSVGQLLMMFGMYTFWSVFGFYLLVVSMRILGQLFVTRNDRLGWLKR